MFVNAVPGGPGELNGPVNPAGPDGLVDLAYECPVVIGRVACVVAIGVLVSVFNTIMSKRGAAAKELNDINGESKVMMVKGRLH